MAQRAEKLRYETRGSVAYAPGYAGAGVRPLPGTHVPLPRPEARPKERVRTHARPRVRVREQGAVSLFAVVGFIAIVAFSALLLLSYVRLTTISAEALELKGQLGVLKTEEAILTARYEQVFDLQSVERAVTADGSMVKPHSSQIIVIDLSEADSVALFGREEAVGGFDGLIHGAGEVLSKVVEYFR